MVWYHKLPIHFLIKGAVHPLGSKWAQGCPLVVAGCSALQKIPSRSTRKVNVEVVRIKKYMTVASKGVPGEHVVLGPFQFGVNRLYQRPWRSVVEWLGCSAQDQRIPGLSPGPT
jgi:hypothetical protein